jgi:hypothetical protein
VAACRASTLVTYCLDSRPSFESWVEVSTTLQLLASAYLQHQHHVGDAKVCHQLEQCLGPLGPWLQLGL